MEIQQIANKLNLSKGAVEILIELIVHNKIAEIYLGNFVEQSQDELKKNLHLLLKENYIVQIDESGINEYSLSNSWKEQLKGKSEVEKYFGKIVGTHLWDENRMGIMRFEGWEGIRKAYVETLEEALEKKTDIYAFESNRENSEIGDEFVQSYVTKRYHNKVHAYVICGNEPEDILYKENFEGPYTHIQLLNNLDLGTNINVVGDLVLSFSLKDQRGVLKRDPEEAKTWLSLFKVLWR